MKNVLESLRAEYAKSHPSGDITFNFGGSGALEFQIENGAPVDLFISASTKYVDALERKKMILAGSRTTVATNQLVIIAPEKNSGIHSPNDLLNRSIRRVAVGDPKSVPAGSYAAEALKNLRLFDRLASKFIYGNDVRQVLTYVETSNADAGVVYTTDALESKNVRIAVQLPDSLHDPIMYPAVIVAASKNQAEAKAFLEFLSSDSARAIFSRFGFR
ncbi:MAG: molybdate ABC transporter substrate-binding protein [Bacteroidota bacterium]|nr:molybdate ABC transporter substrate-binding protein [Bacteroidota bacterium]